MRTGEYQLLTRINRRSQEFYPSLRVAFLETQNSWVPGILTRIEWDYPQYRDSHAPYLSLTPKGVFPAQLLGRGRRK